MKAFLIRYHGATDTKPSRYSIQCEGNPREYFSTDYEAAFKRTDHYLENVAREYSDRHLVRDNPHLVSYHAGTLPNGDICVVTTQEVSKGEVCDGKLS